MTFSMRQLLICVGILGSLLGVGTKVYVEDWGVRISSGHFLSTAQGSSYHWHAAAFANRLRYGVAEPAGIQGGDWLMGRGTTPGKVRLRPEGIYVDGQPIPMTARIYVWTAAYTMQPVELTDEDVEEIGTKPNTQSKAWQEKVEPLIDAEYQIGRARLKLLGPGVHLAR